MLKKTSIAVVIVSIIAICLSAVSLYFAVNPVQPATPQAQEEQKDVQYVMYLGTNDKDTNEPVYEPVEAKEKAEKNLIKHFGGYTIQEAKGGWVDDSGKVFNEYTIVIYLSDTDEKAIHAAADDLIKEFNQSSILIQANETKTEFYAGE